MAPITQTFKLCTFDVTGTLLKFRVPVGEQYVQVGRTYGVLRDPQDMNNCFKKSWKHMNETHPNYGRHTGLTSHFWWREVVRQSFQKDGEMLTQRQLDSISGHLYNLYKSNTCWIVAEGAECVLKSIKRKKVVLGAISNFDERLDSVLSATGLKKYFDFVLASYIARVAKPNRKIFDLALNQAQGLKPEEAIHIGDNVSLDYLASRNAGWSGLLLLGKSDKTEEMEFVSHEDIICSLSEVESRIK